MRSGRNRRKRRTRNNILSFSTFLADVRCILFIAMSVSDAIAASFTARIRRRSVQIAELEYDLDSDRKQLANWVISHGVVDPHEIARVLYEDMQLAAYKGASPERSYDQFKDCIIVHYNFQSHSVTHRLLKHAKMKYHCNEDMAIVYSEIETPATDADRRAYFGDKNKAGLLWVGPTETYGVTPLVSYSNVRTVLGDRSVSGEAIMRLFAAANHRHESKGRRIVAFCAVQSDQHFRQFEVLMEGEEITDAERPWIRVENDGNEEQLG